MNNPERAKFRKLVATARQYCSTIDRLPARNDWLVPLFLLLPQLHAAVVSLDHAEDNACLAVSADLEDRFDLYSELHVLLGERDRYWLEYDHPDEPGVDGEHRTGSLADDLTDIYFELQRGLQLLETGAIDEVANLWQAGFRQHWGQHLVDAERHLYSLNISNRLS